MKRQEVIGFICIIGLVVTWALAAKDKPGKAPAGNAPGAEASAPATPKQPPGAFSDEERRVIQGYVERYGAQEGKRARPLPPGLARKAARGGKLPPGWEKKCVRGETMPVAVYEQSRPLPTELVVKLPPPPELTLTVAVDGKIVRLLKATHEIVDVFDVSVKL